MAGKTRVSGMSGNGRNRNYFQNLAKEVGDLTRTYGKAVDARQNAMTYPPGKREKQAAKATRLRKKQDKDFGQLMGALFQGRRYNKKGEQI
jgi:hypothetical protein